MEPNVFYLKLSGFSEYSLSIRHRKRTAAITTGIDHDDSIAAAEPFQPLLKDFRAVLAQTLPEVQEIVAYNMPGFQIGTEIVASYAAFSKQCGPYLQPRAISEYAEKIAAAGLKATKTGITFSLRKPIPDALVKRLARASIAAAEAE